MRPLYGVAGPGDGVEARTHQLSLLVEVNAALAGALDVESVLGAILSRLADRERLSHARIYRLDEPAGELQRVACGGRNGVGSARRFPPGANASGLGDPAKGGGLRSAGRKGPALPGVRR